MASSDSVGSWQDGTESLLLTATAAADKAVGKQVLGASMACCVACMASQSPGTYIHADDTRQQNVADHGQLAGYSLSAAQDPRHTT